MKKIALVIALLGTNFINAQQHFCSKAKQTSIASQISHQARTSVLAPHISHELKCDIRAFKFKLRTHK